MNVIMRFICLFIFDVGMCVIAGQAMAFDLGGMMKEAQKAVQQQEPNNNIQQPAKQAVQPAVAQPAKQDSNSQKTAVATAPNSVETSEPLELKEIKIGMTAQELLKLYPQAVLSTVPPQSENWVFADQFVTFGNLQTVGMYRGIDCDKGHSINKTCTPVTIMGKMAYKMVMVFVNNKLVDGSINLPREDKQSGELFYDILLEGLSTKFKAKPTSKVLNTGAPANYVFRTAGWVNSSCKCHFIIIDDENYHREGYFVKIELGTDEYKSVVEDRRKTFNALAEKAEAGKDAKAKKDM